LILIRQVGGDDEERNIDVAAHAARSREEGIPLHLVADAADAAVIARDLALCDDDTVAEVRREMSGR